MKLLWSKYLSVGNAIVDSEHRNLISLASDIIRAIETMNDSSLTLAFEQLEQALCVHFANKAGQMPATRAFPMLVTSQLQYLVPYQTNTDNKFPRHLQHNQANTDTYSISNGISFSSSFCKLKQRNASFNFKGG